MPSPHAPATVGRPSTYAVSDPNTIEARAPSAVLTLSVIVHHRGHLRHRDSHTTSSKAADSKALDSSEPQALPI
ncbi:hypothetical protein PC128_g18872 [Phytophthora cactorum]|nr:hypothetical protein PC128_g18872 [Phytophthora cactorum]